MAKLVLAARRQTQKNGAAEKTENQVLGTVDIFEPDRTRQPDGGRALPFCHRSAKLDYA
jgi:hypothetical protein